MHAICTVPSPPISSMLTRNTSSTNRKGQGDVTWKAHLTVTYATASPRYASASAWYASSLAFFSVSPFMLLGHSLVSQVTRALLHVTRALSHATRARLVSHVTRALLQDLSYKRSVTRALFEKGEREYQRRKPEAACGDAAHLLAFLCQPFYKANLASWTPQL